MIYQYRGLGGTVVCENLIMVKIFYKYSWIDTGVFQDVDSSQ